ncbi:Ima1 N-terminal domain-containing protein [Lentinula raphanica]|uniref:Ima1 N-terminal domain-containing protein n=1 Tax=Lentinula raphanica TaxID=153919 RepID=A0AA38P9J0_9AGAR|nr:Ima1 N-terminal domain-containing protein [Lentinula raphanica]KAJ3838837.1 Ima1 N-terminal domain-containing protein [Lentinula raphanica]
MFRRPTQAQCFFCNTLISRIRDPKNFRCSSCGCVNRYDNQGEIISDEPQMHEESLNLQSFSKRASPSKDRLPTSYGSGPFCHNCQTNQHLIINLLSNYLPPPTSPEYQQRLEMLPQYRESLHTRYPPVCESCAPAVEEEIRRKDAMARAQALGGWLKETRGKVRQRRVSATLQEREKVSRELLIWRIRGCLWVITLASFLSGYIFTLFDRRPFNQLSLLQPTLPIFILFSLLWTAWDPTYASIRTAQFQGRDVRVRGKRHYNICQMIAWMTRLVTSILLALQWFHIDYLHLSQRPLELDAQLYFSFLSVLEISVSISSFFVLRIQHPPTIRLINTKHHDVNNSRSSTPIPTEQTTSRAGTPAFMPKISEPDLFASLSLSSQPVVPKSAPVFGLPSLQAPVAPSSVGADEPDDKMDWSPTNPEAAKHSNPPPASSDGSDDGWWLRPQRFFAPEKPTGLESLFEKTKLVDDVPMKDNRASSTNGTNSRWRTHIETWWWLYTGVLVLSMGLFLKLWIGRNRMSENQVHLHHISYDDLVDSIRQSGVYRHTSRTSNQ